MRKTLRIIQVVNVRWFNATAWYGLSLSRLLKRAGHEVLVLGLPGTGSFTRAADMGLEPLPMPLNALNPLRIPLLMRDMARLLKVFRPHVVNCHRGEGMVLWGALKSAGAPFALVRTRGDQRPPKKNPPNRFLHARLADAVIATNSRTAAQCRESFSLPEDRLFMIPGGVDTERFAPDAEARAAVRARLGFAGEDLVVGLLGRFDAVKGHEDLIEALSRARAVLENGPSGPRQRIRLLLLGFPTGTSLETVQGWLREHGMEERTVITGRVEDVAAHINALDLGVVASRGSEAIARAAFEIMACGVPLVGTDVGVMPDLLSASALVPPRNPEALAGLLERSLADDSFRQALRDEQQERMRLFTNQAFLERTLVVYETALRRRSLI